MESDKSNVQGHQHVFMMRHGHRIDKFEPLWVSTAARPWDPPLLLSFVSSFLRCIQTSSEVIAALSTADTPKLKVSIELRLNEMLNTIAIKLEVAPKDGIFDFMISDLEAIYVS
ncbi:unnamed protein product [Eruca vesicaria subsp. sativa]|uniref:Uncharacterized protein n=1 Tax=Eruca vesicaria subsp. sativa TaxID=29727 RepID=A0ABC8IZN1_ERUVS|nr:unnamed protein product [Eruca vesicaria subsp. sativa]